jgi:hypothetical protein
MNELRKQFEEWFMKEYEEVNNSHELSARVIKNIALSSWQASRVAIDKSSIVAYQDPYGNAVSAGDFDGGEDEMHETAFNEGWTPLVRAAGIKVKE